MSPQIIAAVVLNDVRMRARKLSTLVTLLIVITLTWMLVADPETGRSLLVVDKSRAIYDSATLALGSSMIAAFVFGLVGFYLVRGRTRDDVRHGVGGLIAATPIGNGAFVFARWLGSVAYLCALAGALMVTAMVLQSVRGEAPVQPWVFLKTYTLILLPTIMFVAAVAVLCDAYSPLMGKGGDVLFFFQWFTQFSLLPISIGRKLDTLGLLGAVDFSGLGTIVMRFRQLYQTNNFSLGGNTFDPSMPVFTLIDFWSAEMIGMRVLCAAVAMLPLLPAILLFHRYSPDRVDAEKWAGAGKGSIVVAIIHRLSRPAKVLVRPLWTLAPRLPGFIGQTVADLALTLISNPVAVVALAAVSVVGIFVDEKSLGGVLIAGIFCWGILISDISVRDHQSATESLTAAVAGGAARRYLRQLMLSVALGAMFSAVVLLRWSIINWLGAMAIITGVVSLGALASLLGRATRTGRTFLALFLFGLYLAVQVKHSPWFDVVGFNGAATVETVAAQCVIGLMLCVIGVMVNRWRQD